MVNYRCSGYSKKLNVGCWNMRLLVESDGSIATGVSRQGVAVDKKSRCKSFVSLG